MASRMESILREAPQLENDTGIEQDDCRIGSVFLFVARNTLFCPIVSQTVNYCLILENAVYT